MNHPVKAQLLVYISGLPHFHFRRGNQNKTEGPSFLSCKYHVFFFPFKEKKLYKTVCLSPALQLRTAGSLWMGLLFGTAVPFFWATWPAGQDSRSLTRPRREERESLFWCSGWRSRKGEKLKVLCSGSRKNKVGHFYLCNKDIIVLTEEFFSFEMLPSLLLFHFEMFHDWDSCHTDQNWNALPHI